MCFAIVNDDETSFANGFPRQFGVGSDRTVFDGVRFFMPHTPLVSTQYLACYVGYAIRIQKKNFDIAGGGDDYLSAILHNWVHLQHWSNDSTCRVAIISGSNQLRAAAEPKPSPAKPWLHHILAWSGFARNIPLERGRRRARPNRAEPRQH